MLSVENLTFRYGKQSAPVLNGVNLELKQGEIGILLGKNGSGKTTCFKNILGLLSPSGGSIRFDGGEILFYKGDCIFVPADSVVLTLHGQAQFLDVRG